MSKYQQMCIVMFVALLIMPSPAFAWGAKGHQIVALIAEAHLNDTTRDTIKAILPKNDTLAKVRALRFSLCSWKITGSKRFIAIVRLLALRYKYSPEHTACFHPIGQKSEARNLIAFVGSMRSSES